MSTIANPVPRTDDAVVGQSTGNGLRGQIRAQLIMLRTRSTMITLAAAVVVPIGFLVLVFSLGLQTFDLSGADLARPLTDNIGNHALLAPLLGALIAGSQYRHRTIVPFLLASPRRLGTAVATLIVAGAAAAATAVVSAVLGGAVALPWLAAQGVPVGEVLADPDLWWRALNRVVVVAAVGVLGAALALLLRSVLAAVLVYLGVRIAETTLIPFVGEEWYLWFFNVNLDLSTALAVPGLPVPLWQPVVYVAAVLTALVAAALVGVRRRDAL